MTNTNEFLVFAIVMAFNISLLVYLPKNIWHVFTFYNCTYIFTLSRRYCYITLHYITVE